jgi:hypothetical protein
MATSQDEIRFVVTAAMVAVTYSAYQETSNFGDKSWGLDELAGIVLATYVLRRVMEA